MTPKNGFRTGLLVSGILALLILVGILVVGLSSYEGHCISFEPPERPCTILEFLPPYLLLLIVYSIVGRPIWGVIVFVIIISPPVIGYLIGKRKSIRCASCAATGKQQGKQQRKASWHSKRHFSLSPDSNCAQKHPFNASDLLESLRPTSSSAQ